MKEYYFIGEPYGATAAIKEILQEKGVPFKQLESENGCLYSVSQEEVQSVISQGYKPVCIGCSCHSAESVEVLGRYRFNHCSSPLDLVTIRYQVSSDWLNLVLMNDEDRYKEYQYSTMVIPDLIRMGYSRQEIEEVRAYDRKAKGITTDEELAAEKALKTAQVRNGLLIVTDLPHQRYQAVLDRAFWRQRVQNIIIFTGDGNFLYAGMNDIAMEIYHFAKILSVLWIYAEGCFSTQEEQQRIIRELLKLSKNKQRNGIL